MNLPSTVHLQFLWTSPAESLHFPMGYQTLLETSRFFGALTSFIPFVSVNMTHFLIPVTVPSLLKKLPGDVTFTQFPFMIMTPALSRTMSGSLIFHFILFLSINGLAGLFFQTSLFLISLSRLLILESLCRGFSFNFYD